MKVISIVVRVLAAASITAPVLHGQTLNTIYSFGHNELGYKPTSGVVVGLDRSLYGTTSSGGASGLGVVYKLVPPTSPGGEWTQVVIHSFSTRGGDGPPTTGVGLGVGPSGALYGATTYNNVGGDGTVLQLNPPASAGALWRESILHAFAGMNGDGGVPSTTPVLAAQAVLYGTTTFGGTDNLGTALLRFDHALALQPVQGRIKGSFMVDTTPIREIRLASFLSLHLPCISAPALSAAGHVYGRACDIGGFFRQKPQDRARHFTWLSATSHRYQGFYAINTIRLSAFCMQTSVDETGPYRVYANALLRDFSRKTDCKCIYRSFRGSVIDVLSRRTIKSGTRRNIYNSAPATTMPYAHQSNGFPGTKKAADHIRAKDALQACRIHRIQAHLGLQSCRIVNKGRRTPQFLFRLLKEPHYFCFDTNVSPDRDGSATAIPDGTHDLVCQIEAPGEIDGNGIAFFSREQRGRSSDTRAAPGHNDNGSVILSSVERFLTLGDFKYSPSRAEDARIFPPSFRRARRATRRPRPSAWRGRRATRPRAYPGLLSDDGMARPESWP